MTKEELILSFIEKLVDGVDGSEKTSSVKTGFEQYDGKNVFIRTVTHHYTGHVTNVDSMSLTLDKAAWIADDGRFNEFLKDTSKAEEVEPFYHPVTVGLGGILDITTVDSLPEEVK